MRLHLMISRRPRHSLRISRRRRVTSLSALSRHAALSPGSILMLLQLRRIHRLHGPVALRLALRLLLLLSGCGAVGLHVDVGDAAAALGILGERIVRLELGVLGDDVPGVEEAGEEAEHTEEDVDEGVGGAETGLNPD